MEKQDNYGGLVYCRTRSAYSKLMSRIYLERRKPDQNMQRFYALHVVQTIFGEWVLIREWGRIGSGGTVREQWFDTEEEAIVARNRLRTVKEKRGYSQSSVS